METALVETERDVLRRCLRRPLDRVLEAGCGRRVSRADSLAAPGLGVGTVVGVDLDLDAGRANPGLDQFIAADLCGRLPLADATFDLVYASFVVEHLDDPEAAFREWHRLLRDDGVALVVTPNMANPLMRAAAALPQRARVALKRFGPGVAPHDVFPAPYRANTVVALQRLATRSGFALSELRYVATLHRYAGEHRAPKAVLLALERLLPAGKRSTLIALLRPRPSRSQAGSGRSNTATGQPADRVVGLPG
jgi:SAM-dependent methyltransferase